MSSRYFADAIFFIESSNRKRVFPLALCSLESAAMHNPRQRVFLLRTTKGPTTWSPLVQTLANYYANLSLKRINADHQVSGTPLASFWESQNIEKSQWIVPHTRYGRYYWYLWIILTLFKATFSLVITANGFI